MKRDEMLDLRRTLFERIRRMRHTGDYAAGAADIRENAETALKLIDHLLERLK